MRPLRLLCAASLMLASTAAAQDGSETCTAPTAIAEGSFAFNTNNALTGPDYSEGVCVSTLDFDFDMFWVFTATVTGDITIDTNGSSFDTQLAIYSGTNCSAICIADDDDGGFATQSSLDVLGVTAGDQFLIQIGGWNGEQGAGILNIGPIVTDPCASIVDDAFEDNDDCFTPTLISPGSFTNLAVIDPDSDFFQINVPAGMTLTLTETFDSNDCDYNLYDAGCSFLIVNAALTNFSWDNTTGTAQDLVIEAHQWTGATPLCSEYAFDVSVTPTSADPCLSMPDDAFEDNDDCAQAVAVSDGTYSNLFTSRTDKDHYSFCVAPGATVTIDVLFSVATGDLDIFLWEAIDINCGSGPAGGTDLANGFSVTDNETISWTNPTAGDIDVVLEVHAWDSDLNVTNCNTYDMIIAGSGGCTVVTVGTPFCDPMDTNSTGASTALSASFGSGIETDLLLEASNGVPGEFGYFLIGTGVSEPGLTLSDGRLCLAISGGNAFGRYNFGSTTNSIGSFDGAGNFQNLVGTATSNGGYGFDIPTNNPLGGMIMAGETWHFQMWHRDTPSGVGRANFSNGLSITF